MKRAALIDLVRDEKRFATRMKIRWAALVIAIWIVSVAVIVPLIPAGWHRDNVAFFWAVGAIAVLLVTGVVAARRIRERARANGLICGTCGQVLIGDLGQKAVSSGRCPKCGVPMVDDKTA